MSKYNDIKNLSHGDRVRLTGWSEYAKNHNIFHEKIVNFDYDFPIETKVLNDENLGVLFVCLSKNDTFPDNWEIKDFNFCIIDDVNEQPIFKHCTPEQFNYQCKKWNIESTPGVQPQTLQAVLHAPDGTPMVFFICHLDAVNVTIHDGEVGAIIHDQIKAK